MGDEVDGDGRDIVALIEELVADGLTAGRDPASLAQRRIVTAEKD